MYTYEIVTIGSAAGRPYDHAAELQAAGYCLGAGAVGARVSIESVVRRAKRYC